MVKYNPLLISVVQGSITSLLELLLEPSYLQLLFQTSSAPHRRQGFSVLRAAQRRRVNLGRPSPKALGPPGVSFCSLS